MRVREIVLGMLVLAVPTQTTGAGETSSVPFGARVRVRTSAEGGARSEWVVGTFLREDAESLAINLAERGATLVPRRSIERLEISRGRHSRKRGALIGGGIGAAAALAVTAIWAATYSGSDEPLGVSYGAFVYAPLAFGLGAGIGAMIPPGERWEDVSEERIRIGLQPQRAGLAVKLSVSF